MSVAYVRRAIGESLMRRLGTTAIPLTSSGAAALAAALTEAVETYGKPGGPWNVPSEPGSWIAKARAALAAHQALTNDITTTAPADLAAALTEAVETYGKPGGPWNVPSEPGSRKISRGDPMTDLTDAEALRAAYAATPKWSH